MVKHKKLDFFLQHGEKNYLGFTFTFILFYFQNFLFSFLNRQMLGIKNDEEMSVDDPCSDEFYQYFRQTAKKNAQIYEDVFNTLPTNRIRNFTEAKKYIQQPKLKETDPLAVCILSYLTGFL